MNSLAWFTWSCLPSFVSSHSLACIQHPFYSPTQKVLSLNQWLSPMAAHWNHLGVVLEIIDVWVPYLDVIIQLWDEAGSLKKKNLPM